jgi:hypothetical protein
MHTEHVRKSKKVSASSAPAVDSFPRTDNIGKLSTDQFLSLDENNK